MRIHILTHIYIRHRHRPEVHFVPAFRPVNISQQSQHLYNQHKNVPFLNPSRSRYATETGVNIQGPHLLLCYDGSVVVQRVAQDVAAHGFARLKVKVLKERREILELENREHVVVGVHRDLQQPGQLLGHSTTGRNAEQSKDSCVSMY